MRDGRVGQLNDLVTALTEEGHHRHHQGDQATDPTQATALETRRAALVAGVTGERAAANTVQTEAQVATLQQAVENLAAPLEGPPRRHPPQPGAEIEHGPRPRSVDQPPSCKW